MDDYFIEHAEVLIEHLEELANGAEPEDTGNGICWELKGLMNTQSFGPMPRLYPLWEEWPMHSGDEIYPITLGPECNPEELYEAHDNHWSGRQGELRRELCQFAADKLKDYVGEMS